GPVFPTPTIGMVGILEDISKHLTLHFKQEGDLIFLVGKTVNDIACSEYLYQIKKVAFSPAPYFNLEEELAVQELIRDANNKKILRSAHDLSEGGLIISLLESGYPGLLGFKVAATPQGFRKDAFWMGEAQGRVLVSIAPESKQALVQMAAEKGVPLLELGVVGGEEIVLNGESWGKISDWKNDYDTSLEVIMQSNAI
ncbi:MAG: AIR synthase-related protein, partial [Bacteroidota bacterium]